MRVELETALLRTELAIAVLSAELEEEEDMGGKLAGIVGAENEEALCVEGCCELPRKGTNKFGGTRAGVDISSSWGHSGRAAALGELAALTSSSVSVLAF